MRHEEGTRDEARGTSGHSGAFYSYLVPRTSSHSYLIPHTSCLIFHTGSIVTSNGYSCSRASVVVFSTFVSATSYV